MLRNRLFKKFWRSFGCREEIQISISWQNEEKEDSGKIGFQWPTSGVQSSCSRGLFQEEKDCSNVEESNKSRGKTLQHKFTCLCEAWPEAIYLVSQNLIRSPPRSSRRKESILYSLYKENYSVRIFLAEADFRAANLSLGIFPFKNQQRVTNCFPLVRQAQLSLKDSVALFGWQFTLAGETFYIYFTEYLTRNREAFLIGRTWIRCTNSTAPGSHGQWYFMQEIASPCSRKETREGFEGNFLSCRGSTFSKTIQMIPFAKRASVGILI